MADVLPGQRSRGKAHLLAAPILAFTEVERILQQKLRGYSTFYCLLKITIKVPFKIVRQGKKLGK